MRLVQFLLTRIRKNNHMVNNISAWQLDENARQTQFIRKFLTSDFMLNKNLNKLSFFGLSLLAICKNEGRQ